MANSDYTYSQVLNGTGSFSVAGDTGYSAGVSTMQSYLRNIGYTITDTAGRFQSSTLAAVKAFQAEWGITQSGTANQSTIQRLDASRRSTYYTVYGKPLTGMNATKILQGSYDDIDLLARIIYAESGYLAEGTELENDLKGIARVLRARYQDVQEGGTNYCVSASKYPNASAWARIIAYPNQYDTCDSDNAMKPKRGYTASLSTVVDPRWKKAVDLAEMIYDEYWPQVYGYLVEGETILDSLCAATDQMNQIGWDIYVSWKDTNHIDPSVDVITFSQTKYRTNVLAKYQR